MAEIAAASESRLMTIDGVGPVVAARLLGRTDTASCFPTAGAFASYCGTARSRSPAPTRPATACPVTATGSSTTRLSLESRSRPDSALRVITALEFEVELFAKLVTL